MHGDGDASPKPPNKELTMVIGNYKHFITAAILIFLAVGSIFFEPISNLHLVVTIGLAVVVCCGVVKKNQGKVINTAKASYPLVGAFSLNCVISFALGFWLSGLLWLYITLAHLYIRDMFD